MNEIIDGIQGVWDRVQAMPAHLLLVLVLNVIGFALKHTPIPNRWIPCIIVVVSTVVYPLIASPGTVGPTFRNPMVVLALYGFVLGAIAWLVHKVVLRRVEQLLPDWLKP